MSQEILNSINKNWQNALLQNREAIKQLKDLREVEAVNKLKSLELGLAKVPEKEDLPGNIHRTLKSFGIMNEKIDGMVSIPLRKKDSRISNFYLMGLNGKGDKILRQGGVINQKAFNVFKKIVMVDTIDDYFAWFQNVKENIVPLIQSTVMPDDIFLMAKQCSTEEIILLNNSPYWGPLKVKLKHLDVKVFNIVLPEEKKVKEFLKNNSENKLLAYIEGEKAKTVKKNSGDRSQDSEDEEETEYLKVTEDTGEMNFTAEDRSYRVRGFNRDGFEKIVQLNLEVEGNSFPDKVDLSRSQSRARFAGIAGAEFEMSVETIRDDLTFIYKRLDKMQDKRFKEKAGISEKQVYEITPDEIKKAIDTACSRDILDELLIKDTERTGFMDEEINKKLFYISATSRLTGKPLSVLDISPSGTGKSFCMSSILELVPPDEADINSRLTSKTLYYKDEEDIRGKVLSIEELVGIEEALESIRMIVSAEMLSTSGVEKDPRTGMMRSVKRMVKASIPIISGGTRDLFDEETLSRFILTYNDLSEGHIKRILKSQAKKYSDTGTRSGVHIEKILKRHRDIQKSFDKNCVVIIPFSDRIMLNPKLHIVTRKQEHYLRLIYNTAFIRQHSREKRREVDKNGNERVYIRAMRDDVVTVNEIMRYVFRYVLCYLTKRQHDAYLVILACCSEKVKEKRINLYEYKFSRREIREYAGWDEMATRRFFNELEGLEYIRKVRGDKQGTRYLYKLVPFEHIQPGDDDLQLLDPDSL